jgi:hypothetical protein
MEKKDNAAVMRELRLMMLKTSPSQMGCLPSEAFPNVFSVLMDWPIENAIATVRGDCQGGASLYTTANFGILGGEGHERVRNAAKSFVQTGELFRERAAKTIDFEYPAKERTRFYLVCFDEVRLIELDTARLLVEGGEFLALFVAGQTLLSELGKTRSLGS